MRDRVIELLTYAALLALLVIGGGFALVTWGPTLACQHLSLLCPPAPGEEALSPFVEQYLLAAGLETDPDEYMFGVNYQAPIGQQAYRVGRVAVVDVDRRAIDRKLTQALPADTVAMHPADVETVIWVRWGEHQVGTYHDVASDRQLGEAYQGYCQIVVIDRAAGSIVGEAYYEAAAPPSTTTSMGDIHTQLDVTLVANWVKSLPVRDSPGPNATSSASPTPLGSPSPTPATALQPGESFTLNGDVSELTILLPDEQIEMLPGEYTVVFKGSADEACTVCVSVTLGGKVATGEHFVYAISKAAEHVRVGRWNFTDHFTLTGADAGNYYFQLKAPVGSWSLKLTRDQ